MDDCAQFFTILERWLRSRDMMYRGTFKEIVDFLLFNDREALLKYVFEMGGSQRIPGGNGRDVCCQKSDAGPAEQEAT